MTTLDPRTRAFYVRALRLLTESGLPFLVGGAYAFERHTGISRHTKDLDVFVALADVEQALGLFRRHGYKAEHAHPHWLAKVHDGDAFVDVIYRSGNGLAEVDRSWFENGTPGEVFETPVRLLAAEEMIWSKAFIMERERFDGADVAHLIRACGPELDWNRMLERFGSHWRVLYAHVMLFGYIYPGEAERIPPAVVDRLARRLTAETAEPRARGSRLCRGTLLSRSQYLIDIGEWGYGDARLQPLGRMTTEDVAQWTRAIAEDGSF